MATYVVTFRDGSEAEVEAREYSRDAEGVTFTGAKYQQAPKTFVAFIPYGDLRMVREVHDRNK